MQATIFNPSISFSAIEEAIMERATDLKDRLAAVATMAVNNGAELSKVADLCEAITSDMQALSNTITEHQCGLSIGRHFRNGVEVAEAASA